MNNINSMQVALNDAGADVFYWIGGNLQGHFPYHPKELVTINGQQIEGEGSISLEFIGTGLVPEGTPIAAGEDGVAVAMDISGTHILPATAPLRNINSVGSEPGDAIRSTGPDPNTPPQWLPIIEAVEYVTELPDRSIIEGTQRASYLFATLPMTGAGVPDRTEPVVQWSVLEAVPERHVYKLDIHGEGYRAPELSSPGGTVDPNDYALFNIIRISHSVVTGDLQNTSPLGQALVDGNTRHVSINLCLTPDPSVGPHLVIPLESDNHYNWSAQDDALPSAALVDKYRANPDTVYFVLRTGQHGTTAPGSERWHTRDAAHRLAPRRLQVGAPRLPRRPGSDQLGGRRAREPDRGQ